MADDFDPTTAPEPDRSTAKKWWVALAVIVGLGVLFQGPILDGLVQSDAFVEYGYCADFDSCAQAASDAMIEVRQEVGEDVARDCLAAHTAVMSRLLREQNAKERAGMCVVTGAVLNERVGAAFWSLPWLVED
ncbi:hypothetical protein E3T39_00930 [Cryobacterium suzukii]|uniref:Uncharacterized protein n=1 Tax=Cryobacterium suzukii TaxID=1259198 RepID=A0A4R9AHV0_9MICO|nr:hypothetical protein [Cryobacterium suzukii]TFD62548.1 hypothetical protein E3T39_00930 [Cryobacterium suzukii]